MLPTELRATTFRVQPLQKIVWRCEQRLTAGLTREERLLVRRLLIHMRVERSNWRGGLSSIAPKQLRAWPLNSEREMRLMQQPPIRSPSIIAAFVYSHSGEFGAVSSDLRLPGRGLDVEFVWSYRSSLAGRIGELGRGWSCNLAKRLERDGRDVLYHDGTGSVHRFAQEKNGAYAAPPGFYAVLREIEGEVVLEQRFDGLTRFRLPEQGGELLNVQDRNGNELRFLFDSDSVQIVDTLNRRVTVSVQDGLWRDVMDHTGRRWQFHYDANGLLVEVVRPATRDFPEGTALRYGYDSKHRLVTLTDAKGQTYLVNRYDKLDRIISQRHGAGEYVLEYEAGRTRCCLKNGGLLELDHDEAGHVTRSTLHVRRQAFSANDVTAPGGTVALVTESTYNGAGELIGRRLPSGRETRWTYADADPDPRNRGNLLEIAQIPQPGAASDYERIVRKFEYARAFQVVAASVDPRGHRTAFEYDDRGNLVATTYPSVSIQPVGEERAKANAVERVQQVRREYNAHGQLTRRTEIDGAVIELSYHPDDAPRGPGLLARVVRDSEGVRLTNEYRYDELGNCTEVVDGKDNAARLTYNAMGKVESSISRAPFEYRIDYVYDANYNEIEAIESFERFEIDQATGRTGSRTSTRREQRTYDELGNVTERRIVGGDKVIRESFVRDSGDRLVRQIQPLGNVTEYVFDERDLVIEKRFAVGAPEGFTERFTYTLDGSPRTWTDGDDNTTQHRYDGFERYQGFTNPAGTTKHQALDEAGNVIAVTVTEDERRLMEARYRVDEWNRVFRIDRAWHDIETGKPAGKSEWDDGEGIVSTVVEYGENGRTSKVWHESGNVVEYAYDGCGRLKALTDLTGQALSVAYDDNSNVTEVTVSGAGGRGRNVLRRSYDAMDRLELQQVGGADPERFRYNALGAVVEYIGSSGLSVHHTYDALGRHTGHAYAVPGAAHQGVEANAAEALARRVAVKPASPAEERSIVREYEYDDNYRLAAYVDAAENRTIYKYDELDRQVRVVRPDGAVVRVEYDARGNAVHIVDANGRETSKRYDAAGRLVETTDSSGQTWRYEYDGAGRLMSALGRETLRRTYDSLSHVKTETQSRGTVRFAHDSAGNLTTLVYPSGQEVRRKYDVRHRVTSVERSDGTPIATFAYDDGDRVSSVRYGDALVATLEYDGQQRLQSIEYRTTTNNELVDGYRYAYDSTDKMTHEIQLLAGDTFGERYFFDEARRPVCAQYGVKDVFDPNSSFDRQTTYEYFPEGRWSRRTDVDSGGQVVSKSVGTINRRNRYRSFGKYTFDYDQNGNCVRKESANPGFCLYTYDSANRLIKVECYDVNARRVQTIEYFYDALGRLTRKVVTDAAGVSTEYTYVWIGSLLAEEYENGTLVRTYVYGIGAVPVQLSSQKVGRDFTYLLNGRGLVSGIVRNDDPNAFAEKYGYEVTGSVFLTEVDGVPVDIPSRPTTVSGLDNPLVTGDVFGSVIADWANGTLSSSGGGHMNTTISDALNALGDVGAKGHHGVTSQMADQLNSIVGMLGLGGNTSAPPSSGGDPGFTMNPDWKLYADGENSADGGTTSTTGTMPADAPLNTNLTPSNTGSSGTEATSGIGGKDGKGTPPDLPNDPGKNLASGMIDNFRKDHPVLSKAAEIIINSVGASIGGTKKMTDPDATDNTKVTMPTPGDLEAKFNRLKHPVNPNGGPVDEPVDTSSPPPQTGGVDPTQILVDPDATGGSGSGVSGGINKIDIAPIDKVRDWPPEPGSTPPPTVNAPGGETTIGWHQP